MGAALPAKGTSLNEHILNAIDVELAKLRQARAILANSGQAPAAARPRRKLSAKARKAIADAQHKRWARVKSQKKAGASAVAAKKAAS